MELSPFQELWLYSHVKRRQLLDQDKEEGYAKLLCTFINPKAAEKAFKEKEVSESAGFVDDLKELFPNFNPDDYKDVLEEEEELK